MHRELTSIERPFQKESHLGLYVFTGLLIFLVGLEAWPWLSGWMMGVSPIKPYPGLVIGSWTIRFVVLAALLGLFRLCYTTLNSLFAGRIGADLAMLIAVVAAFLIQEPVVAAEVILIGLIGECLEAYTFGRTQKALRRLVETFPTMCLVQRDGQTVKISIDEVKPGDRVMILPGKRVPVDGVVVDGHSSVDQSSLTGESIPTDVAAGSDVFAGTVNQFGALVVEAKQVATQTVMGRMLDLTAKALQRKTQVELLVDRMARYFLPVVLGLALLTFLFHFGLSRHQPSPGKAAIYPALAVLVVACPCALILATPAALMAAVARLAKTGVLLKGVSSLEQLAKVDALFFDKTGTLTEGRLQMGKIHPLQADQSEEAVLRLAASVEQRSEHPMARLLLRTAQERNLALKEIADFQALPGAGVRARVEGRETLVASVAFAQQAGIEWPPELSKCLEEMDQLGQTTLLLIVEGRVLGAMGVWDTIRPEAAATLEQLRQLGIQEIALVTGDRHAPAKRIAELLQIPHVMAECLPERKAEWVDRWRHEGKSLAMIGDGVNDALALAKADVGLALSGVGSDLAAEAGDIILMGEPLQPLPLLIRLSRQVVAIIRQNILYFAFGVNLIGVLLTAWILPLWSEAGRQQAPIWAAIYHQIGSLAVLLNAMRLLWFERQAPAGGWWQRLRQGSQAVDDWIDRFRLHDLLHRLEERWRTTLAAALLLFLAGYLASGFWIIEADQVGVVVRCGKALDSELQPGLHWRWPWPWEQVLRVEPRRLRGVEVGYRSQRPGATGADPLTWASPHSGMVLAERDESLMLTGDGNLIELQWLIHYTIRDARKYLFAAAEPDQILRALAESVLRELLAEQWFQDVLSGQRETLQKTVMLRLKSRLQAEAYDRLGVDVRDLSFQDVHPPLEVVDAYYGVTRANSERSRRITEEKGRVDGLLASENVHRIRGRAAWQANYDAARLRAEAERDAFLAMHGALRVPWPLMPPLPFAPDAGMAAYLQWAAWAERMADAMAASPAEMWQFRQSIESAEQWLQGRWKILRDPKVKGQIHLLPDAFRFRPPSFTGRDRPPWSEDRP